MIPLFPAFKPLEITDRNDVESYTARFPPYSDFNFTSLFCYDTMNQFRVSLLHGNLVVKMLDYVMGSPFYTFLGSNEAANTAGRLLNLSASEGIEPMLRLVPACSIDPSIAERFNVTEDPDGFDYMYSAETLSGLSGQPYARKRKRVGEFKRSHADHAVIPLDLGCPKTRDRILEVLGSWQEQNHKPDSDVAVEFTAIRRCFEYVKHFDLAAIGLLVDQTLVGFAVTECVLSKCLMGHFLKADPHYAHATDVLCVEMVKAGFVRGCIDFNCQQDLGLPGLRFSKQSWRPTRFLRKHTVARRL